MENKKTPKKKWEDMTDTEQQKWLDKRKALLPWMILINFLLSSAALVFAIVKAIR